MVDSEQKTYLTPFVPVEYLENVIPEKLHYALRQTFDCESDYKHEERVTLDVKLRGMVEYVFNENEYGKVNRTLQTYTYPVDIVNGNDANTDFQDIVSMRMDYETSEDLVPCDPTPGELYFDAWNSIEISHIVNPHPQNPTTFKANNIRLNPGAELKPGVTLKTGLPFPDRPKINQVSSSYLNSFCNNTYQAHLPLNPVSNLKSATIEKDEVITMVGVESGQDKKNKEFNQISIYPNPNNGDFYIRGIEKTYKICIYSVNGTMLYEYENSAKLDEIKLSLDNFGSGCRIVRLYDNERVITKKIILK